MVTLNTNATGLWGRNPAERQALVATLVEKCGVIVTRKQILDAANSVGKTIADVRWLFNNKAFRAGRGQYTLAPLVLNSVGVEAPVEAAMA